MSAAPPAGDSPTYWRKFSPAILKPVLRPREEECIRLAPAGRLLSEISGRYGNRSLHRHLHPNMTDDQILAAFRINVAQVRVEGDSGRRPDLSLGT